MSSTFTPAQHKMLAAAFQCFDAQPKVDYTRLAEILGLKNGASAKTGWCALRRKLLNADPAALFAFGEEAEADGEGEGAGKAKGKGGAKGKKRKVEEVDDEERKDSASPAPAAKKRTKATKKVETAASEVEADDPKPGVKEEKKSDDEGGEEAESSDGDAEAGRETAE